MQLKSPFETRKLTLFTWLLAFIFDCIMLFTSSSFNYSRKSFTDNISKSFAPQSWQLFYCCCFFCIVALLYEHHIIMTVLSGCCWNFCFYSFFCFVSLIFLMKNLLLQTRKVKIFLWFYSPNGVAALLFGEDHSIVFLILFLVFQISQNRNGSYSGMLQLYI